MTVASETFELQIGIDLGGTKIEGLALDRNGDERARLRIAAPRNGYAATLQAIADLVAELENAASGSASIGIGMPGSISPATGLVQNANSTWLNGRPLATDLEALFGPRVKLANDANCFALSEATDGAGAGARSIFGIILGTGCGGGLVINGKLIDGPRAIGGEWGHNPLPSPSPAEMPGPRCWCGRNGCMEAWVSGPALATDHLRATGHTAAAEEIACLADAGDVAARATLDRHAHRLARGVAAVINIFDPEVIVLGGGLSKLSHLYDVLPALIAPHVFADEARIIIRPPKWGDASGVRGAAWLWGR